MVFFARQCLIKTVLKISGTVSLDSVGDCINSYFGVVKLVRFFINVK